MIFFFKANFPFHLTNTFSLQHLKTYYLFKNRKWNSWSELFIDSYMEIKLLNLRLGLEATVTHHHVFSVFSFHFLSPLWSPCLCRFAKEESRLSLCSAWHDGRCGSGLPSRASLRVPSSRASDAHSDDPPLLLLRRWRSLRQVSFPQVSGSLSSHCLPSF